MTEPTVQCLVGADGHVGAFAYTEDAEFLFALNFLVLQELGVTGFRLDRLPVDAAVSSFTESENCEACKVTLHCGCRIDKVASGECDHGSLTVLSAANRAVRARLN